MIEWIIRRSVANRFLVMMAALFLSICGTWTIVHTPVDALPDLYDHWIAKDLLTYLNLAMGSRKRGEFLKIANRPNRYLSRDAFEEANVSFDALLEYYEEKDWMCQRIRKLEQDITTLTHLSPFGAVNYRLFFFLGLVYIRKQRVAPRVAGVRVFQKLDRQPRPKRRPSAALNAAEFKRVFCIAGGKPRKQSVEVQKLIGFLPVVRIHQTVQYAAHDFVSVVNVGQERQKFSLGAFYF